MTPKNSFFGLYLNVILTYPFYVPSKSSISSRENNGARGSVGYQLYVRNDFEKGKLSTFSITAYFCM